MRYSPRHAIRAVRALPLWAKVATPVATALALAGGSAFLAAGAGASVSPTTTYTDAGVAGYYAAPNANRLGNGDKVTGVRSTFNLTPAAENVNIDLGVELCRYQSLTTVQAAAVLFAQWNPADFGGNGGFDIYANHNISSGCLDQFGGTGGGTVIDQIPAGHTVQLEITVSQHHIITFTDSDETTQTGGVTTFGGFTFGFDRAGVGANGDTGTLTTPASNLVTNFNQSGVRDGSGWALLNRKGLTRLVVNKVVDTSSGTSAGGVLITPGPIGANSGNFPLYFGQLSGI